MTSAVIVAAGMGKRMGAGFNKAYLTLGGRTIIENTVRVFQNTQSIDEIVVVTDDTEKCRELLRDFGKVSAIVRGGETRQESVKNGLLAAKGDFVAIHDGARALVLEADIEKVVSEAQIYGAAALGVKCTDTLKFADKGGFIEKTVDRAFVYRIQTPQVFRREEITELHKACGGDFTDDCALFENAGKRVKITEGSYSNIKITTPEDLAVAEKILEKRKKQ